MTLADTVFLLAALAQSPDPRSTLTGAAGLEGVVRGRLVDVRGAPVRGRVRVQEVDSHILTWNSPRAVSAESDEDGRFQIRGLPPASYGLGVTAIAFVPRRIEVSVAAPGTVELGDVVLDAGLTIRGVVLGGNRSPVARAWLSADPISNDDTINTGKAQTADDGRFVIAGLAPGRYRLRVIA